MFTQIVRTATTNNFNCTPQEYKQLKFFRKKYPTSYFFVNSNIHTPLLRTILRTNLKIVITANPNLTDTEGVIETLLPLKKHIAFIRVKYLPDHPQIDALIRKLAARKIPVVVTLQRFCNKNTLEQFTEPNLYKWSCSRFRLKDCKALYKLVDSLKNVYICDRAGKGCQTCKLCSTLTTGEDLPIKSLNLSSSGICPYKCPDCFAKAMQHFAVSCGHKPITFNKVAANAKQAGRLKHQQ